MTANICDTIFGRLSSRGLIHFEIPKLVNDVVNLLGDGGYFTISSINQDLAQKGWQNGILDEITFQLILLLLEEEYEYEIETFKLH